MADAARVLAPAKLTLSLRVTGRRADGYHELSSEMVSIDLCDELQIDADGRRPRDRGRWAARRDRWRS